jgi:hypothetical protein
MSPARLCLALLACASTLAGAAPASAQGPLGPLNDLFAFSQGDGQQPDRVPTQKDPGELNAVPRAQCGPGSKPEPSIQGRVPAGSADEGLYCNMTMLAHQGTSGGFRTYRYVDPAGHECAYYDTALLFPLNAFNFNSSGLGVAVLDMKDPAKPEQTANLTEPAMLSPHESVSLNQKRGLIAAVSGNPDTYPGWVSIYDASKDCRKPELQFSGPLARLGHESGFSVDGKTFYATSVNNNAITAIDVTDPKAPFVVWLGKINSHGMTLSPDGNRAYLADTTGQLTILDTSEIQARKPNPQAKEISRLTGNRASIPQNAIPFTKNGHPYVLEFDEYTAGTTGSGSGDDVGAGRIIDIADETKPRVVSNLRLQVNQPAEHKQYGSDPGADGFANGFVQGYAAHYCNLNSRVNPTLVACSFIVSGLRLFDISDVTAPKEIGYFVAPVKAKVENGQQASSFAMSMPTIVGKRHEVWYTDGATGFYVVRVADAVWPKRPRPAAATCALVVKLPRGAKVKRVSATVGGKHVKVLSRKRTGRKLRVKVSAASGSALRVRVTLKGGGKRTAKRAC